MTDKERFEARQDRLKQRATYLVLAGCCGEVSNEEDVCCTRPFGHNGGHRCEVIEDGPVIRTCRWGA